MNVGELAFALRHPIQTVRAARRQLFVSLEWEAPPHTATVEGFCQMSVVQAAQAIRAAEPSIERGNIPRSAWSKSDQKRMRQGAKPQHYPEHPCV